MLAYGGTANNVRWRSTEKLFCFFKLALEICPAKKTPS